MSIELVKRCEKLVPQYKEYAEEFYQHNITYFRPYNPKSIDEEWFQRTLDWYTQKEEGLLYPQSLYWWAVEEGKFIGEFQLRPKLDEEIMCGMGSVGYSVRMSEWNKGYGKAILKEGLRMARELGLDKVLFTINEDNKASQHICEALGGVLQDKIEAENDAEGKHILRRYWVAL